METKSQAYETFEISPRFRVSVEERIARLEQDATLDELALAKLRHEGHLQRHRRMIAVQRADALRMRLFLDKARTRSLLA